MGSTVHIQTNFPSSLESCLAGTWTMWMLRSITVFDKLDISEISGARKGNGSALVASRNHGTI